MVRDFLEWRRELRTIEDLGAYRTDTRNLVAGNAAPGPIRMAELTAAAFGTARVPPLLGRALLDSDEVPGAPTVVVLGYDVWQRSLGARHDVVGSVVTLANTPATVIGVMPDGFRYPVNHDAWMPLQLRASYDALEGGAVGVIGRLAPGVTRERANAELRVLGERAAAALPATHGHLRLRVMGLGERPVGPDIAQFAMRNLPVLLVLIVQVALTAMGIPVAMEGAGEAMRNLKIRAAFPSREYLAARIDLDRPFEEEATSGFEERWAQTFAALERRIAQEPGVVAVTFADRAPGSGPRTRFGEVESSPGAGPAYEGLFWTSAVGRGFFEAFDRPIVAGRAFHGGDRSPGARTVIVNEAFAREFSRDAGSGSPIGARLRYSESSARPDGSAAEPWFEIVGVVRDVGLDPDDWGDEQPYVFHAASAGTVSPLVMSVRVRGNPATLAACLLACIGPATRALRINPTDALREA